MSYYVGDDATITYPVTTTTGDLDWSPVVTAWASDDTEQAVTGSAWLGDPGPERDLEVPLGDLPAGLWSLRLTIAGEPDLFLSNVVIQ